MKIGMIGCGKLGLMVALTIESKGHEVVGYDIDPRIGEYLQKRKIPFEYKKQDEIESVYWILGHLEDSFVDINKYIDSLYLQYR